MAMYVHVNIYLLKLKEIKIKIHRFTVFGSGIASRFTLRKATAD